MAQKYVEYLKKPVEKTVDTALLLVCEDDRYVENIMKYLARQVDKSLALYVAFRPSCRLTEEEVGELLKPEGIEDEDDEEQDKEDEEDTKGEKEGDDGKLFFFLSGLDRDDEEDEEKEKEEEEKKRYASLRCLTIPEGQSVTQFVNAFASQMAEERLILLDSRDELTNGDSVKQLTDNARLLNDKTLCVLAQGYDCNYEMIGKGYAVIPQYAEAFSGGRGSAGEALLSNLSPLLFYGLLSKRFFTELGGLSERTEKPSGLDIVLCLLQHGKRFAFLPTPLIRFRDNGFTGYSMIFDKNAYARYREETAAVVRERVLEGEGEFTRSQRRCAAFRSKRLFSWGAMGRADKLAFLLRYFPLIVKRRIGRYRDKRANVEKIPLIELFFFAALCLLAGSSLLASNPASATGACSFALGAAVSLILGVRLIKSCIV